MSKDISSNEDVLDVRDIIERFEELEDERQAFVDLSEDEDETSETRDKAKENLEAWDADNGDELKTLRDLLEDLKGNGGDERWRGDWYPVTLIRDSYFTDYAEELLKDCGDLPQNIPHYIEIDWEATAKNIRVDYSSVEFGGVTYWYR